MSWSYSGDPSTSTRDAVRWHIGDTDSDEQMVSNEEIDFALGRNTAPLRAAIEVLESVASRYARQVDTSTGGISVMLGARSAAIRAQVDTLRAQLQRHEGVPTFYAGGQSEAERVTDRSDIDLVQPRFGRNQFRDRRRRVHGRNSGYSDYGSRY